VCVSLAVVLAGFLIGMPSAHADYGFHGYSKFWEASPYGPSRYSGISVYRNDVAISNIPNTGCLGPIEGDPVYQTEWILLNTAQTNWVELGTGHQCQDHYVYWYAGYGYNGTWNLLVSESGVTEGIGHTFQIVRNIYGYYVYTIDGTVITTYGQAGQAAADMTGLESYSYYATLNSYGHGNLQFQIDTNPTWYSWSGEDGSEVDARMCGYWAAPTLVGVWEKTPC
jgi:hypothetical protein